MQLKADIGETGQMQRCSTVQTRLLRLEKLWPVAAAIVAGFRAAEDHLEPAARMSVSCMFKSTPLLHRGPRSVAS
jgi:hypothetical protein